MGSKIDHERAAMIKEMLWRGRSQEEISAVTTVSQSTISRIKSGLTHSDVLWPDGSTGAMPARAATPIEVDWSADAKRLLAFPEEMQQRILDTVNARRQEANLPLLPAQSPEYAAYLQMDPEEAAFEALALEQARKEEDRRLAEVMREFDRIVSEESSVVRAAAILRTIEATRREPDPSRNGTGVTAPTDLTYSKLPWDVVAQRAPDNPIVLEAASSVALMEACCIVFFHIKEAIALWSSSRIHEEIRRLAARLREMPLLMERIEREYAIDEEE